MKFQVAAGKFNLFKPKQFMRSWASTSEAIGVNFRITGDPISAYGKHIGKVIDLNYTAGRWEKHDLRACRAALSRNGYLSREAVLLFDV
jgi:hypothetical protein